jgi:hypothetical protein
MKNMEKETRPQPVKMTSPGQSFGARRAVKPGEESISVHLRRQIARNCLKMNNLQINYCSFRSSPVTPGQTKSNQFFTAFALCACLPADARWANNAKTPGRTPVKPDQTIVHSFLIAVTATSG